MKTKDTGLWCKVITMALVVATLTMLPQNSRAGSIVTNAVSSSEHPLTQAEYTALMQQLADPFYMEKLPPADASKPNPQVALWVCVLVITAAGVATYYALKALCKAAGLTNTTPPIVPPPPPPNTNTPPRRAKSMELSASYAQGTNAVFQQTSNYNGVAVFDATGLNALYGMNAFLDPSGFPYTICSRIVIEWTTDPTTNSWSKEIVTYVWRNDAYICAAVYNGSGGLEECVVTNATATSIALESHNDHLLPRRDVPRRFFRLSASPP